MRDFPQIKTTCYGSGGSSCYNGKMDVSFRGIPEWEVCDICNGTKVVVREMTTEEKLQYLLNKSVLSE